MLKLTGILCQHQRPAPTRQETRLQFQTPNLRTPRTHSNYVENQTVQPPIPHLA